MPAATAALLELAHVGLGQQGLGKLFGLGQEQLGKHGPPQVAGAPALLTTARQLGVLDRQTEEIVDSI